MFIFPHYPGDHLAPAEQDEYREWERQFKAWNRHCWTIRDAAFHNKGFGEDWAKLKETRPCPTIDEMEHLLTCVSPFTARWDRENWRVILECPDPSQKGTQ